jgi:hypothetical protein
VNATGTINRFFATAAGSVAGGGAAASHDVEGQVGLPSLTPCTTGRVGVGAWERHNLPEQASNPSPPLLLLHITVCSTIAL